MTNKVDMADVCDLAHKLTVRECRFKGIEVDDCEFEDSETYTIKAQEIYEFYYKLITETLNV